MIMAAILATNGRAIPSTQRIAYCRRNFAVLTCQSNPYQPKLLPRIPVPVEQWKFSYLVVTFLIDLLRVIMVTVQTTKSTIMFITYIIMMMGLYCGPRTINGSAIITTGTERGDLKLECLLC